MNPYIRDFITNAVMEGRAHDVLFQEDKVEDALLTTGKCAIGYDGVLAIIRVSGLTPDEQRKAKLVVADALKELHA